MFRPFSFDDCILRYLGYLEERSKATRNKLKNPIIWFRVGFQEIISIPLYIFNWFGIFSKRSVNAIMESSLYKIFNGFTTLIVLISGIVTIIQGKEKTIEFIKEFLNI